jgi:glycosyltransferase involved in cell wall biosynthesis
MKIHTVLFIHPISNLGGASISLIDNIKMLKDDFKIKLIVPHDINSSMLEKLENMQIDIYKFTGYIPKFSFYSGSSPLFSRTVLKELVSNLINRKQFVEYVKNLEFDILILNTSILSVLGKLLQEINQPKILYIRETFKENLISRLIIKSINRYFNQVLSISSYENKYAQFKIPSCVISDVYEKKDNEIQTNNLNDLFKVVYLGGISSLKGFLVLAKSLKYLNSNIEIYILGDLNYKNSIGKWYMHPIMHCRYKNAKRILSDEKVKAIGLTENAAQYIDMSQLVIFPSTKPHQPRPVIEAGFHHKTAVITDYIQTSEFYRDNYNVLTFKKNDPKDLAQKINSLAINEDLRLYLSNNNYKMSVMHHSFDIEKKKMIEIINQIMNGDRRI